MVQFLLTRGHPNALDYSLPELEAWVDIVEQDERRKDARLLMVLATSQSDAKDIKKSLKEWMAD